MQGIASRLAPEKPPAVARDDIKKMNGRRWRLVAIVVVAVILLVAFATRSSDTPVRAEKAQRESIVNTISTNGKIEPVDNFEAHAPAPTTVKRLFVHEGDHVKAGQKILQLDDANARADAARALAQLKAAQASLAALKTGGTNEEVLNREADLTKAKAERDSAQRNLNAMQELQKRGAASPAEVEEAQNRYQKAQADVTALEKKQTSRYSRPEVAKVQADAGQAQAAYAAAQELLRDANVTAPRDGVVYSLPVREGAYVNAGDLLVQIADLGSVQVRAFVDEPEIGKLAVGQSVAVTWDALPGRTWRGALTRVPTTVTQRGTRTVGEITCTVTNGDMSLLPNTNVNVSVTTTKHDNAL
ncbi:MAG TPA: HlyD family efflux transporter periplasmic adaptor subunit, partial [Terriglobales bacterium]|nr:HlyD family efflux transporter periplasmic adaptor subunit [Terriglobales bacterium]